MSVGSITSLAQVRNFRIPTKVDSGEAPYGTEKAGEAPSFLQLVVKQVPVALIAPYTALTAAIVQLIEAPTVENPDPDDFLIIRWIGYGVLVLASVLSTWIMYRYKVGKAARKPIAETIGVGGSAAAWGLMIPESPMLAMAEGPLGAALVLLVGFIAVCLNFVVAMRLRQPIAG